VTVLQLLLGVQCCWQLLSDGGACVDFGGNKATPQQLAHSLGLHAKKP
jgi:hypothetical protein